MTTSVDTLIVGLGLAGLAYAETLYQNDVSFHVIDATTSGSSKIAAGIYNPTVLKRFNLSWKGDEFHAFSLPFYQAIEHRLQQQFLFPTPIKKIFNSYSDHNQWTTASDRAGLKKFLSPTLDFEAINGVKAPYGFGEVLHCGRLNTQDILQKYQQWLGDRISFIPFDSNQLEVHEGAFSYGSIQAKRIVFCEGYAMKNNPWFNALPLVGSKGQILIVEIPELTSAFILKGSIFLAPLGNQLFWAGASFEQHDKSFTLTEDSAQWIRSKMEQMIDLPYEVKNHLAHIRPTVKDRRPLLGEHVNISNMHVFNGLGSRGVLTAPLAAQWLYSSIYENEPLPSEVNISRFKISE